MKRFLKYAITAFVIVALAASIAACNNVGFLFSCDIEDGATVILPEYSFNISAAYCGEECDVSVSLNGVLTAGGGSGKYTIQLDKGENLIKITATRSNFSETRVYHVRYRADFEISTDIDEAVIVNESISFTAGATFNDLPCALIAEIGGEELEEKEGVFTATLKEGENIISLIARYGDLTKRMERRINLGKFSLNTDLSDGDRTEAEFSFRAAVAYDGEPLPIKVALNGKEIQPDGNRFNLTLERGENKITIAAEKENIRKTYEYTVRFIDDPPTLETTLKDGKTYRGSKLGFDVTAKDGLGEKLPSGNISFSADWNESGDFAPLTSVKKVWDDSAFTSFEINFKGSEFFSHANSSFGFKVTAADGAGRETSAVYEMTYVPAENGEKTGEVVFALEGFSIGCGYFIEPCRLPVYEGVNFAATLTEIIEENGWTYSNTGTIEKGFYLSGITGLDLSGNRIPDELWALIPGRAYQSMPEPENGEKYELSEFCYAQGGGWMYSVNTVYKNYGFSDYYPQDGDVVRVQFTVALGSDLGGGGALGGSGSVSWLTDNPDYGEIMGLLADISQRIEEDGGDKTVYNEVLDKITKWNISQKTMDEQISKLKSAYGI